MNFSKMTMTEIKQTKEYKELKYNCKSKLKKNELIKILDANTKQLLTETFQEVGISEMIIEIESNMLITKDDYYNDFKQKIKDIENIPDGDCIQTSEKIEKAVFEYIKQIECFIKQFNYKFENINYDYPFKSMDKTDNYDEEPQLSLIKLDEFKHNIDKKTARFISMNSKYLFENGYAEDYLIDNYEWKGNVFIRLCKLLIREEHKHNIDFLSEFQNRIPL